MYTMWTSHLKTESEKEKFRNQVISAKPALERLQALLEEAGEKIENTTEDPSTFDTPNWAYLMAFNSGYKACISFIEKLIDLDQQETK